MSTITALYLAHEGCLPQELTVGITYSANSGTYRVESILRDGLGGFRVICDNRNLWIEASHVVAVETERVK